MPALPLAPRFRYRLAPIPYADGGPTHASNLKYYCRTQHLLKTFWGWDDRQLADGTVIWSVPDGQTYVTMPGSAMLFPGLCAGAGLPPRNPRFQCSRAQAFSLGDYRCADGTPRRHSRTAAIAVLSPRWCPVAGSV